MFVIKCDICKKEIERDERMQLTISKPSMLMLEFCEKCAKPIKKFLKNKKLIKTNE